MLKRLNLLTFLVLFVSNFACKNQSCANKKPNQFSESHKKQVTLECNNTCKKTKLVCADFLASVKKLVLDLPACKADPACFQFFRSKESQKEGKLDTEACRKVPVCNKYLAEKKRQLDIDACTTTCVQDFMLSNRYTARRLTCLSQEAKTCDDIRNCNRCLSIHCRHNGVKWVALRSATTRPSSQPNRKQKLPSSQPNLKHK